MTMNGLRSQQLFAGAQSYKQQQLSAVGNGQKYTPVSQYEADFNASSSRFSSQNYYKGAEMMTSPVLAQRALQGIDQKQAAQIIDLIPNGSTFYDANGNAHVKGKSKWPITTRMVTFRHYHRDSL